MFICLWLTTTSYISRIAQRVLPNAQFARKNVLRSKSLNYIARDKIKRITLCVSLCPWARFAHGRQEVTITFAWALKTKEERTRRRRRGKRKRDKGGKKDNVRRGCDEKSEAGRGETWKMRRRRGIPFRLVVRPTVRALHDRVSKERKSLVRAQSRGPNFY